MDRKERAEWRAKTAIELELHLKKLALEGETEAVQVQAASRLHAIIEGAPATSGKMTHEGQITLAQLVTQSYATPEET